MRSVYVHLFFVPCEHIISNIGTKSSKYQIGFTFSRKVKLIIFDVSNAKSKPEEVQQPNFRQHGHMGKQRREESEKRRDEKRRDEKKKEDQGRERAIRKKMQVREKVGKSEKTAFFQCFGVPESGQMRWREGMREAHA